MVSIIPPLNAQVEIVDEQGRPTPMFSRLLQKISAGTGLTATGGTIGLAAIAAKTILANKLGTVANATACTISDILDFITSTRGSIIYRGAAGWAALAPSTAGFILQTNGAGADPTWVTAPTGGGGGSTPTIRSSNIQSSSAASYTVTWPTGTIAGDVVVIFGGHGFSFNNPTGWTVFDNNQGSNFNGATFAKVMTAGDIATGNATITTTGAFNGVLAAVTLTGTTVKLVRMPGTSVRSASGVTSAILISNNATSVDRILAFIATRGATNCTFSAGFTSLQAINAASASGAVANFTGTFTQMGLSETGAFAAAGTGYYSCVLAIQGP